MKTYSASLIVIKRLDVGEKDRILTVFTREYGKYSAIAKGCRKPGSKLAGSSEPFTYLRAMLNAGREIDIIAQSDIKESFPKIKSDILAMAYGFYMLELVNLFTDERHPTPELFDTLLSTLYVLECGTDPEIATRHFELNLLDVIGYMPQYDSCVRCGSDFGRDRVAFSPTLGGIVCTECGIMPNDSIWIPGALASYFKALYETDPNRLPELNFPNGAKADLAKTLKWHIRYRLEKDLKSTEYLDMILDRVNVMKK